MTATELDEMTGLGRNIIFRKIKYLFLLGNMLENRNISWGS